MLNLTGANRDPRRAWQTVPEPWWVDDIARHPCFLGGSLRWLPACIFHGDTDGFVAQGKGVTWHLASAIVEKH